MNRPICSRHAASEPSLKRYLMRKCFIGLSLFAFRSLPARLAPEGAPLQVWTKMIARESSMNIQRKTLPTRESIQPHGCPVMAFQAMISGKYKIRILWDLKDGPRRYSEIRTGLLRGADGTAEIAPRVLSRELK